MLQPKDVSVVLISYARPWNMPIICESLFDYGFEDVHLVDNWVDDDLLRCAFDEDLMSQVNMVRTKFNCKTAARYIPIGDLKNNVVATVDDDYMVTRDGWDQLLENWDGTRIVAQLPSRNEKFQRAYNVPFLDIGYGSLFDRRWPTTVWEFLSSQGVITIDQWKVFADRIFTTFFGVWDALEATDETLVRLRNPGNGNYSETDGSSIHLQEGYWEKQWALVMRLMLERANTRKLYMKSDPSLSEFQEQMGFLSHTGYGDSVIGSG